MNPLIYLMLSMCIIALAISHVFSRPELRFCATTGHMLGWECLAVTTHVGLCLLLWGAPQIAIYPGLLAAAMGYPLAQTATRYPSPYPGIAQAAFVIPVAILIGASGGLIVVGQ